MVVYGKYQEVFTISISILRSTPVSHFFFLYIKRVLAKGQQKYVEKKSCLSPDPVKRTGEIEAGDGGPVNIRGTLTLLF